MADASFVIDIASQVRGVSATTSELDSLAGQLSANGAKAAMFDDALARLSGELESASAATTASNAALADGSAKYARLEKDAVGAAQAVERMDAKLAAARATLNATQVNLASAIDAGAAASEIATLEKAAEKAASKLQRVTAASKGLGAARAASASASAAVRDYAGDLDRLTKEATEAASAQKKLGKTMASTAKLQRRVNDNVGDAATNLSAYRGALGDIGGPVAELGERMLFPAQAFVDLNEKFGRGTAIATVAGFGLVRVATAIITALVAVAAALAAVTIAMVAFAFSASNAARDLALVAEAAEIANPALRGLPFREITNDTGIASARLRELAATLTEAKVSAADLPAALRAAATAENALGAGGADKFIADMRAGKLSVQDFANTVESEFGNVVERKMLGLEAQGARFKRNLSDMFTFDIDPALEGLAVLVSMFDKNSASGKAMRKALSGLMDPIIANAKAAAQVVEAFVLGLLIGATKIYIAVAPAIDAISELLGLEGKEFDLDKALDLAAEAGEALLPVLVVIGAILAAVGVAIGVVLGVILLATGAAIAFGGAVLAAVGVVVGSFVALVAYVGGELYSAFTSTIDLMSSLPAKAGEVGASMAAEFATGLEFLAELPARALQLGTDLIAGLVNGITAGAGAVVSAIVGVASGALNAAARVLGIKSPSTKMYDIGDDTVTGYENALDDGRDGAQAAMAAVVDPVPAQDAAHAAIRPLTLPSVEAASAALPPRAGASASPAASAASSTDTKTTTIYIERVEVPMRTDSGAENFLEWAEGLALQGAAA